ncbi:MAG TPA: PAS domain S-box protein, partial [Motiliproteus sp.]
MTLSTNRLPIPRIALFALVLSVFWSLLVGVSGYWNYQKTEQLMMQQVLAEARASLDKDVSIRQWAIRQQRLYAPLGPARQPVPWLQHPQRDVTTTAGETLTMIDPATINHEVMDLFTEGFGVSGRLVGLNSLNPANAPSPWERAQLERFAHSGVAEIWDHYEAEGIRYLRYMRALSMEPGCAGCHPKLRPEQGGVLGAALVQIPLTTYLEQLSIYVHPMLVSHGIIWLSGLLVVLFGSRAVYSQELRRERLRHRYQLIFEQSMDGILLVDPETQQFSDFNRQAHEQLGYSYDEFAALTLRDIESLETPEETRQHIQTVVARGWDSFETLHRHRDGSLRNVHVNVRLIDLDGRQIFHVSFRDITQRKQAEKLAEQEHQRFLDMVNTTDGIVWEADAQSFTFTFISDTAERLLGYPVSDWYRPGFWVEHLHPDDREWAAQYCAECTGRLEPQDFEYRILAADGRVLWLHDLVTVVAEQGQPRW